MRVLMVFFILASLSLAGCTDSPEEDGPTEGSTPDGGEGTAPESSQNVSALVMTIDAVGVYPFNPAFDPMEFTVKNGTAVTITYTNRDNNPVVGHDLRISGVDVQTPNLANGESAELTFTVDLPPGEYPYWCTIGNHREQGMEGVMIVTA